MKANELISFLQKNESCEVVIETTTGFEEIKQVDIVGENIILSTSEPLANARETAMQYLIRAIDDSCELDRKDSSCSSCAIFSVCTRK